LIVPHGDVVEYRISGDMVECLLTRNVPAAVADNGSKLALVIELDRLARYCDGGRMPDEAGGEAGKRPLDSREE